MTNALVEAIARNPEYYTGSFSFRYGNERITQVIMFGKHVDSIMIGTF